VSPTMNQLFAARSVLPLSSPTTFFDPVLGATVTRPAGSVTVTSGGNPGLRPESGRAYNYGVIITPRRLPGLTVSADLYHVVSYDQIRTPSVQTVVSFFPGRVTRDAANNVTAYDTSAVNMSQVVVGGADFRVAYDFTVAGVGAFTWQGGATYTDYYKQIAVIGNPFLQGVGDRTLDFGAPQRLKGSTSLTLTRDRWSAGFTARYVGKYKDTFNSGIAVAPPIVVVPVDGDFIRAQTEFDLRFTYEFAGDRTGWRGVLRNTKVALGALNVLDRRPPYVSSLVGGAAYSYYNDPRMRYVYLEMKRKF
jgi:iron complex outermembrane recepter protein